jgi:hypothetical protein
MKTPDPIILFVGDLHAGHIAAVAPVGLSSSDDSAQLLAHWQTMTARVLAEAKGRELVLMLGGDLVEGVHHGGHELWSTTYKQQRDAAVSLLLPLANRAAAVYGLRGTSTHAGSEAEDDQTVCEALGAKTANYVWQMEIAGQRLYWSHHGVGVARDPQNESNGLYQDTKRHYEGAIHRGQPVPHLIVHHHAHFSPAPVTAHGITAAVCPCWKAQDEHGAKIGPERTPDIGVLVWEPTRHKLDRWLYPLGERRYAPVKLK